MFDPVDWEPRFEAWLNELEEGDAAHGISHIKRVVANAKKLAQSSDANFAIIIPAAWLHDCVCVAKDSPLRSQASSLAAKAARDFLETSGYPTDWLNEIEHAITAHSFSAGIDPQTLEAKIVQDADRLDALGAIGIARCLQTGTAMGSVLYDADDPFAENRQAEDRISIIDHFYTKLLSLADTMKTAAGREEAKFRTVFMRDYLDQLRRELR
ncbi:HD domain-containing protein [bacterium]|nr:HD domain-containing protein [bacterium]